MWGCNVEEKEPPPLKNPKEDIFVIRILPCRGTSKYSLIVSKMSLVSLTCSFFSSYLFFWMLQLEQLRVLKAHIGT
jgi:hypothetical protein